MTRRATAHVLASASEDSIVLLAMNGDDDAYGELVRRRQDSIRTLLRRLVRDTSAADDLAQQVFITGWHSIRNLKSRAALGAWLRKMAVNTWLQQQRGTKQTGELDEDLLVDAPTPRLEARLDLDEALAQLRPEVRLCVVLAYSEGMSHGEIHEHTELPLGTIKSHLTRGTARLRQLLEGYAENPDAGA